MKNKYIVPNQIPVANNEITTNNANIKNNNNNNYQQKIEKSKT